MKLKTSKYLYFVYQYGVLDYISVNKKQALEMAKCPDGYIAYRVERWKRYDDKSYHYELTIQE